MKTERYRLKVSGIVQGVGFRPFIYNLAVSLFLKGRVNNTNEGVEIEVEGGEDHLEAFLLRLKKDAPTLARIHKIDLERLPYKGYGDFRIEESKITSASGTFISPDVSICEDCKKELFDIADYRYRYPFINCTNCGPRFTIIKDIPYDRPNTTMSSFEMCETCRTQYEDPTDRRYHAQPVSCHKCGPALLLLDGSGKPVACKDVVDRARGLLAEGRILAVKGLGGYHLACDAGSKKAVAELRRRKHRDEKPFALMAKDRETALKHCYADAAEIALLESAGKPVVLLKRKPDCTLPREIAPGNPYLGIMLPYTPVHLLLFTGTKGQVPCPKHDGDKGTGLSSLAKSPDIEAKGPDILVMTSGNISSEPICYKDAEALEDLAGIADFFLTNDREIFIRTDDSVTRSFMGREYLIRRARGYAPAPVLTSIPGLPGNPPSILACGGELKNTFCLGKGQEFHISQHIGDLENLETMEAFEEGIEHFKRLFGISPDIIAYDLHPDYLSSRYAVASEIACKTGIQHHKAHIASCMADNNIGGDVIGVAFDGTGFGEDGRIWGGEFFTGSYQGFRRAGHLEYVRMPGSGLAAREPWRMAASWLGHAGLDARFLAEDGRVDAISPADKEKIAAGLDVVSKMLATGFNSPYTSSMGRLFDAVSALSGVRYVSSFEGQAAMELEYAADPGVNGGYDYNVEISDGVYILDVAGIMEGILKDRKNNITAGIISSRFHETIAVMVADVCRRLRMDTGLDRVALSGGVFQNMLLLSKCMEKLESNAFRVFIHGRVPTNDGGLSLGQAVIAMANCRHFCYNKRGQESLMK